MMKRLNIALITGLLPFSSLCCGQNVQLPKTTVSTKFSDIRFEPVVPGVTRSLIFGSFTENKPTAFFLKFQPGTVTGLHSHSREYYGHVVQGKFKHFLTAEDDKQHDSALGPGGMWVQPGGEIHNDYCIGPEECVLYVFFPRGFDFQMVNMKK